MTDKIHWDDCCKELPKDSPAAPRPTACSTAIDAVSRQRLEQVFDVLDGLVGDFDPEIPDDWTDEDVMIEEPLFWCCREVNRVLYPENWQKD